MLTPDKYIPLHVDLEKSKYREVSRFAADRGWTISYFVRNALEMEMDRVRHIENSNLEWSPQVRKA